MGLSPMDYANLSMRSFQNMVEAYHIRRSKEFEHTRVIAYYIAAANRDPKKPFPSTVQKFWPLPTDTDGVVKTIDEDRKKRIMELYEKAKQEWQG